MLSEAKWTKKWTQASRSRQTQLFQLNEVEVKGNAKTKATMTKHSD